MNQQKLLELAGQLVVASAVNQTEEVEKISKQLADELRQLTPTQKNDDEIKPPSLEKDFYGFLKFDNKEISKMPKSFRYTFKAEGQTICYRKRRRGKYYGNGSYEARYRRHGYNISVSSTNLNDLKIKFIDALHNAEQEVNLPKVPTTFHEFATYYFDKFRARKVAKKTLQGDINRYNNHIKPALGSTPLRLIAPIQCQAIIDCISERGYKKTATEVFSLLNCIFKTAIAHGIIERNPLAIVIKDGYVQEHGQSLTKTEEAHLLNVTAGTPYQLMFAVALYTGLRPNEFLSARIDGKFIVALNSKRKNKKIEYKKIPITPMLRPYLDGVAELKFYVPYCMREKFKEILPNHKLYDLRTTFYTRCVECGVSDIALKLFAGHTLGKLADAYTDISDEYLLQEGEKINY